MPEELKSKGIHYGYAIVVAGFLSQVVLIICQSSFSQVLADFLVAFNITKTDAGVITSTFGLVYALSAILWGWVNDRLGSRITYAVMGFGAPIMMLVFANFTFSVSTGVVLYSLIGLFAGGMAAASLPKITAAWFTPSKRGFAMGIISAGGVVSGALIGVVVPQVLVATGSWSTTLTIMGISGLVIAAVMVLLMRNNPSDKHTVPMGPEEEVRIQLEDQERVAAKAKKPGIGAYISALKLKNIWILGLFYIGFQFAYSGTNSFLSLSIRDLGYDAIIAGYAVTVYNVAQIIGQQIWGNVSDHIQRKLAMALGCVTWGVFGAVFCFVYGQTILIMYSVIFLMGIGLGVMSVKQAIMCDYIPSDIRGTGSGVVTTFAIVGRYTGPLLTGVISDMMGIQWAFLIMGIAMWIAAAIVMLLPKISKAEAI